MRIALIGTGNIGSALGDRWQQAGHAVIYGSRSPRGDGPGGAPVTSIDSAISDAEVVLIAVPGKAVDALVRDHGSLLDGKVVIDAANRIGEQSLNSREAISDASPGARYVRAFNTLGWENFARPLDAADLFFAANAEARPVAEELIGAVGLRPVYVGDEGASGTVDALLPLWFALVQQRGGERRLAFRVVEAG